LAAVHRLRTGRTLFVDQIVWLICDQNKGRPSLLDRQRVLRALKLICYDTSREQRQRQTSLRLKHDRDRRSGLDLVLQAERIKGREQTKDHPGPLVFPTALFLWLLLIYQLRVILQRFLNQSLSREYLFWY
jgi:hypothetical protein